MHRAQGRGGTSRAGGEPRAAPPSPGIPPKRAKVTAEPGAPEEGPARPAAPFFARKLKNAAIGTGCDIRLRVVAVGNPRPSLRWYRNEELLAPRGEEYGTLWIRDSKKEDAGVYTCIAENERGEAMTSAVLAIIDMEGKGGLAAGSAVLAQPRARVRRGWQRCFAGSCLSACPGPARAELCCACHAAGWGEHVAAVPAARPGRVPGPGTEVSGACDAKPARGRRRERDVARVHVTGGATLRSHRHGPWYPPVPLHKPLAHQIPAGRAAHGIAITAVPGTGTALGELGPSGGGAGGRSLTLQEVGLSSGWSLCPAVGGAWLISGGGASFCRPLKAIPRPLCSSLLGAAARRAPLGHRECVGAAVGPCTGGPHPARVGLILHRSQAGLGLGPLCPRMDATSLGCCRPECWGICGAGWWHCSEM